MKKILMTMAAAMTLALAGCGGGGGSAGTPSVPNPAVAGFWKGTNSVNRSFDVLSFKDGQAWAWYSAVGGPANFTSPSGMINAAGSVAGTTVNDRFSDYFFENASVNVGSLVATTVANTSINGTLTYDLGGGGTFSGTYDNQSTGTATLAPLAGTYTGTTVVGGGTTTGTVTFVAGATSATINGAVTGCTYTGTATPRTDNIKAYDLSITYAAGCPAAGATVTGATYYDVLGNRLYAAGLNGAAGTVASAGYVFVGSK